jgi:hypothetical protein
MLLSFLGLQEVVSCPRPVLGATGEAKLPERLRVVTFSMAFKNAWIVYLHVFVVWHRNILCGVYANVLRLCRDER